MILEGILALKRKAMHEMDTVPVDIARQSTQRSRPQHLSILLADWMSGVTVQAIFYGKSQFDITEKVRGSTVYTKALEIVYSFRS